MSVLFAFLLHVTRVGSEFGSVKFFFLFRGSRLGSVGLAAEPVLVRFCEILPAIHLESPENRKNPVHKNSDFFNLSIWRNPAPLFSQLLGHEHPNTRVHVRQFGNPN